MNQISAGIQTSESPSTLLRTKSSLAQSAAAGVSAATLRPTDFRGLRCWLDGSEESTLILDSNSKVQQWSDRSGMEAHAVQPSESARPSLGGPIKGLANLLFNGTSTHLLIDQLAALINGPGVAHSIFIAFKPLNISQDATVFSWSQSGVATPSYLNALLFNSTQQYLTVQNASGSPAILSYGKLYTEVNTLAIVHKNGKTSIWLNGFPIIAEGNQSQPAFSGLNRCTVGAVIQQNPNRFFNGHICEVIIYDRALTRNKIEQLNAYLSYRWQARQSADLFMIAGQSNATGQGDSSLSVPVASNSAYEVEGGSFVQLADPVGLANTGSAWPAFASQWHGLTERISFFLPESVDGSGQVPGTSSNGTWEAGGDLFSAAVSSWQETLPRIASHPKYDLRFKAILWCQGERDATFITDGVITPEQYKSELRNMINGFNSELGADTRFLIFKTGMLNSGDTAGMAAVRAAQEQIVGEISTASFAFENAVHFPFQSKMNDNVHYNQDGLNEMGLRGAENTVERLRILSDEFAPKI